ncbi:NAD(P)-binding protein [Trichoderma gracile]
MSSTKVIAVLGATGNQGGSVADVFLSAPGWTVRALTRNTASPKAQSLASRGAELVRADMDDPATLSPAFAGAHAIFAVSDFWGLYGDPANKGKPVPGQPLNVWAAEHEVQQLKNVIDAAAKVDSLERFVLSGLSNATKWSGGKYTHVYHFDSKARAEDYLRETYPELWVKTSVFQAGLFLSNFVVNPIMRPVKNKDGVAQFIGNIDVDVKFPFIAAEEDSGPFVKALVDEPAGKNVIGYREWLTHRELAAVFSQATGIPAEAVQLPEGQSKVTSPPELKLELDDNFAYWNEFGYEGRDDPTVIHPRDLATLGKLDTVYNYFKKFDWNKILDEA